MDTLFYSFCENCEKKVDFLKDEYFLSEIQEKDQEKQNFILACSKKC
jgi:hypothetical protein